MSGGRALSWVNGFPCTLIVAYLYRDRNVRGQGAVLGEWFLLNLVHQLHPLDEVLQLKQQLDITNYHCSEMFGDKAQHQTSVINCY